MKSRENIAVLWPRRIELFDKLNANPAFLEAKRAFSTAPVRPDRQALHAMVSGHLGPAPIDYLEFGVASGASLKLWVGLNTAPGSRFFGFDTFDGIPENWESNTPKGAFAQAKVPSFDDHRVRLIQGLFQQTLYPFVDKYQRQGRVVVHVDCDLYSAALFSLAVLDRHLLAGDVVIFDEFYSLNHEFAAFTDYTRSFHRVLEPLASTPQCVQAAFAVG